MKKLSLLLIVVIVAGYGANINAQPVLSLTPVITGLTLPMQVVNAGDGTGRIFVIQKTGAIRVFDKNYTSLGTFLTVTGITSSGERGLLSLAFHPDYKNNGYFFVYYTNSTGDLQIARYKVSADPNVADPASKDTVITIPHPNATNHNGGELHFGADGYLYLSTGDGGGSGDPTNNAQNTAVLLGKLLRFNVSTSEVPPLYTIPPGNPFGNEIFAYGLRNPFRWSFDALTGDLWIGDVGEGTSEEVDHRLANAVAGTNFGWRCYEGNGAYNTTGCGPSSNYTFPIFTYPTANPSASVTGGTVYRGETYINLKGYYLAADFYSGRFYKIKYNGAAYDTSSQVLSPTGISDFGETEDGELYASCLNNGNVYRVSSDGPIQYTFTGNGNWDVASNWSNRTIPPSTLPSGCIIVIRPVAGGECVLNVPQTVPQGTQIIVDNDKQFRINGNLTVQ